MWDVEISDGDLRRPYRIIREIKVVDGSFHQDQQVLLREKVARFGANAVINVTMSESGFPHWRTIIRGTAVLADCMCQGPTSTYASPRRAKLASGVDSGRRCIECNGHVDTAT